MQGVVFVAIHQRLRELGDEELRRQCFPEASAYLAFREYPDTDIVGIARAIADHVPTLAQPIGEVMRSLGEEVIASLQQTNPGILPTVTSLANVIDQLGGEPDARLLLPRFRPERADDGRVSLLHFGDPAVCRFDEGLLIGLAAMGGERVATRHPSCRARRDPSCIFFPRVVSGDAAGRRISRTFRFERPGEEPGT